jgi:PAS domain S-box-containing protein
MEDIYGKNRPNTAIIDISTLISIGKVGLWKWHIQENRFLIDDSGYNKSRQNNQKASTVEEWLSEIYSDDRDRVRQSLMNHIIKNSTDSIEVEYRIKKSTGEYAWLLLNGIVTEYRNNKPVLMNGVILDITSRKTIENELYLKKEEIEALYEESEAQNEEMSVILDELQNNQIKLESANSRLLISEKKFRNIFDNAPLGIIQSTLTGKIIRVNNAFCKMFGFDSPEDLLENLQDTSEFYTDANIRDGLLKRLAEKDMVHEHNIIVLKKDKSRVFTNGYFIKMTDEFTGEKYITTFVEDITQLKSSQHEHDLFFNSSGDLLCITDSRWKIKQANPAWTSELGWDTDYLRTTDLDGLIHPDDLAKTGRFLAKIKKSDRVLTLTNRLKSRNGEYRLIRWNCKSFKEMDLVFLSGRDETERYEAELDLRQIWDRLDGALKAAVIALWDFNIPEGTLSLNRNMAEFLGLNTNIIRDSETVRKRYIYENDFPFLVKKMEDFIRYNHGTYTDELKIRMHDGKYRWFFARGKVVEYDATGNPVRVAGSAMDITEQKEAELKRIEIEQKMQQSQKLESLGLLAGGIAHDFNNLLTGILGNTDILLYEIPGDSEIRSRLLEIKKTAKMASDLTHQMLAYSGKGSFIIEQINRNELFLDIVSLLEASISKKVRLHYDLIEDPPWIKGDATKIRQVVINLVLNASDAIDNTGVITVRTSRAVLTEIDRKSLVIKPDPAAGHFLLLEVTDTGCGIEKNKLEQIFDPFYTTKFTGRGLGLAAVSGIIRSHNAGLTLKSRPGKGTSFKIYFPESEGGVTIEKEVRNRLPYLSKTTPLILIADDEKYIRDITGRMLAMSGYESCHAGNGHELMNIFLSRKNEISCIILDLTMPEMDGYETLAEIRKTDSRVPIIITSGYGENEITGELAERKVSGFLQKPFSLEELISAIEQAMI